MDTTHAVLLFLNIGVLGAIMVLSGVIKTVLETKTKR